MPVSAALLQRFELPQADPLLGIAITLYILGSAWQIVAQALGQLMDRELPTSEREHIVGIVLGHPGVRNLHDLRTRRSGQMSFIQLHLELPAGITLIRAHAIADEVEQAIRAAYPNSEVLIHTDPAGLAEPHAQAGFD